MDSEHGTAPVQVWYDQLRSSDNGHKKKAAPRAYSLMSGMFIPSRKHLRDIAATTTARIQAI